MCYSDDARPPLPPVGGAASDHGDMTLAASDGNKLMAYFARAAKPTGAGIVVMPDVRGLPLHEHKKRLCELIPRSRKHGWFLAITSNVTVATFSDPRAAWTSRAMSRSSTCAIYGGRSPQHLHLNRESPTHKPKADMNSSRKCAIRPRLRQALFEAV